MQLGDRMGRNQPGGFCGLKDAWQRFWIVATHYVVMSQPDVDSSGYAASVLDDLLYHLSRQLRRLLGLQVKSVQPSC